jgi:hypothetical protein
MNPYEQWYGNSLIDDIHNYFPDILYNPDQFTSVRDLTNYIANSVRSRFHPELFAAAADAAAPRLTMTRHMPLRHTHHWTAAAAMPSMFTSYHIPMETRRPPPVVQPSEEVQTTIRNFNASQRELMSLVDLTMGLLGARTAAALEPVRVGATAEQLEAASRTLVVSDTTINANCAICVEPINVGDNCRRITRCHHLFHKDCIDQHFRTSVRCPLCRIDIRELEPAAGEAPAPVPAPPSTQP